MVTSLSPVGSAKKRRGYKGTGFGSASCPVQGNADSLINASAPTGCRSLP